MFSQIFAAGFESFSSFKLLPIICICISKRRKICSHRGKSDDNNFSFFLLWKPEVLLEYSNKLFLQCFVCLIGCGEEWKESLLVAGEWQRQDNSPSMASQWLLVLVPVVLVASAWDSLSQRLLTMQLGNNLPYILTLQYYLILFVPKPYCLQLMFSLPTRFS